MLIAAALSAGTPAVHADRGRVLRVCADPNSWPLSSKRQRGFEDDLARLLAAELGARVEYTWWAQRRGFYRNTLKAGACDVVIGMPAGGGPPFVRTTAPYYRSVYTLVTRAADRLDLRSLDDPRLATLRIGVQLAGDEGANPPPVHALARRRIIDNVIGYSVFRDYAQPDPATDALRALVAGEVDVAIAWGPIAGGFAARAEVPLSIVPLGDTPGDPTMAFSIALGVRKADAALAAELERALAARKKDVARLLARWRIPLVEARR